MLLYLSLLLVVSVPIYCKQITKNQQISSYKLNCKNIKCPPIEDPVCVRIKNVNEKNKKITFIIAVNKCEMQYAKCRPGIDAVKVPMENCLHKNSSGKRIRRAVSAEMPSIAVFVAKKNSDENPIEDATTVPDDQNEDIADGTDKALKKGEEEMENVRDNNHIGADYDQPAQDVDYVQYEKDCPTVCPARKVMVCARCQHNIYRTFLSPCHLRVFHCKYPDEELELVSRQPCMQSAPFLTNFPDPKGVVSEPGDQDNILKFIYCREKGRIGKNDPRCKFDET